MKKQWILLLVCLVWSLGGNAQETLARSVSIDAGLNTFPIPDFAEISPEGRRKPGVGYHFGLTGTLHNRRGKWSYLFSVLYSQEVGSITGVERASELSSFTGDVDINERRWRYGISARAQLSDRLDLQFGIAASSLQRAEHRYAYRGSASALPDPITGRLVELPEPIILEGTSTFHRGNLNAYVSFPVGFGYLIIPKLRLGLEGDFGVRQVFLDKREGYRISGTRVLLTASYRLLARTR